MASKSVNPFWKKRSYSARTGEWSDRPGFSRHGALRPASKSVSKSYQGYRVYTSGEEWKTDLDPESGFDSEQDVKNFINWWNRKSVRGKYNPGLLDSLRKKFANPLKSSAQFRLAQATLGGAKTSMPKSIARELLSKTSERAKKRFARGNPEDIDSLAQGFHGRAPEDEILLTEESQYAKDQAVIGLLEELEIVSEDGLSVTPINFKHHDHRSAFAKNGKEQDTVYVTFPNRNQIEFIGGDQTLPVDDKALVNVGPIYGVTYWTDKHHLSDGTGFSSYHHHFGEESVKVKKVMANGDERPTQEEMLARMSYMPLLVYDSVNRKCLLVGGVYSVRDEGITN